jgi:hypothetical protein
VNKVQNNCKTIQGVGTYCTVGRKVASGGHCPCSVSTATSTGDRNAEVPGGNSLIDYTKGAGYTGIYLRETVVGENYMKNKL